MTHPRRQPRWLGVVFLTVMVQLLLWNLYVARRNQKQFPADDVPRPRSRDIGKLLMQNPMGVVKHTFAMYHQLRVIQGKTLVLPERWAAHEFYLERVARLDVQVTSDRLELPIEVTDRLYASVDRYLQADASTPLEVILDPAATRYLLVERSSGGLALIVSEELYRRERAALGTP